MRINLKNWSTRFALLIFFITFLAWSAKPVKSAPLSEQLLDSCTTVQFIMMIDQSASMERNDPNRLRYYAPLHVADVLARAYINARLTADRLKRPMHYKFAVVQFASSAKVGLEWQDIAPVDDASWQNQRSEIVPQINLDRDAINQLYAEIGNGTNMKAAFQKVADLLSDQTQVNGCPERWIMMLTDGGPDSGGDPLEGEYLKTYMTELNTDIISPNFSANGNHISITGINVSGDKYWPNTETYWQDITRESERKDPEPVRAQKVENKAEIGYRIDQIVLYALHGGIVAAHVGPNTIPPYLERAIFTFYKPDQDNVIELRDPKGNLLVNNPGSVNIVGTTEGIQTLEIIHPMPGIYNLTTTAQTGDFFITKDFIFVQTKLIEPISSLQQFTSGQIQLELVDNTGKPLPDYDPKYRLVVTGNVTTKKGLYPISVTHESGSILQGNITPWEAGPHHLSLTASALDDDSQKWEVLKVPYADYDLIVDPVSFNVGTATSDQAGCALTQFNSFSMPVQVINDNTKQNTEISIPIKWTIDTPGITLKGSTGPVNGAYSLNLVTNQVGAIDMKITASVTNPKDVNLFAFASKQVGLDLENGYKYQFSVQSIGPEADAIVKWLEEENDRLVGGIKGQNTLIIGRRLFFWNQDVVVKAKLVDTINGSTVNHSNQLPTLSFEPVSKTPASAGSSTKPIPGKTWEAKKDGLYSIGSNLGLGCYKVVLNTAAAACGVEFETEPVIGQVCLVPDLGERIIVAIACILGIAVFIFIILLILCKFNNPLEGYLAITPTGGGEPRWYHSIYGWSCWFFNIPQTMVIDCGLVTRIEVHGLLMPRRKFKLIYYKIDPQTNRVRRTVRDCDINDSRWRDIDLLNGRSILWRSNENEFQR
jgi:hypothetical protein